MYRYEDVKVVHLEVTERCQAGCPMCGRFDLEGNVNKHVINATMSLSDSEKIFEKDLIGRLEHMYMCGNFGDPIIAPDTLQIFERFRDLNFRMRLSMYTNGGAKPADWWRDLAGVLLPETRSRVVFAIDGLEDTNDVYRINVKWDNVMRSAEAFIGAGGLAEWHFLVFKHNEHQIDLARETAKRMGFKDFKLKKSSRFWSKDKDKGFRGIELPTNLAYVNDKSKFMAEVNERYGSYEKYLDETPIRCMVKDTGSVYVSARGEIFPCCWVGYDKYHHTNSHPAYKFFENTDEINALKRPMREIFAGGYFDEIEKSWSLGSVAEGKIKTCAKTCSLNNFFRSQFAD